MTLEAFYNIFTTNSALICLALVAAPFLAYLLCFLIPGRKEEPFILSINLWLALLTMVLWVGYLSFALNVRGWERLVKEANLLLLLAPPYYFVTSLLLSRQRLPLNRLPAFRTVQGLALMLIVYVILSWLGQRIHIIFFSYIPFTVFLLMLAVLLGIAYLGFRRIFSRTPKL